MYISARNEKDGRHEGLQFFYVTEGSNSGTDRVGRTSGTQFPSVVLGPLSVRDGTVLRVNPPWSSPKDID